MKAIHIFVLMLFSLIVFGAGNEQPQAKEVTSVAASGLAYSYPSHTTQTTDTVTNSEVLTFVVPTNLFSGLSFNWYVTGTNISGTTAIAVSVQESNMLSGNTDWVEVATATIDANETVRATGARVYGVRQRIVLTGSGTQVAQVKFNARYKY